MSNGDSFNFGDGGYGGNPLAIFLGILGAVLNELLYELAALFNLVGEDIFALLGGEQFLFGGLSAIGGFVKVLLGTIVAGLGHIITDLFHGHLKQVLEDIIALLHKLRDLVAPLIAVLKKLQAIQRQLHTQAMRQLIDLIQRARKILVVFRLLHIGWAKKLDAYLAGFESDLARKWLNLVRHINAVTGALDVLIDPRGILRPGHTLAGVGAAIGALEGAIGALGFRQLLCLPADTYSSPIGEPWVVTETRVMTEIRHNTGDYALYRAQRDRALRQYAIDLGVTALV